MQPVTDQRTKIVATLGPACDAPGVMERMIAAGVDVVRINLSHAPPRDHVERRARVRAFKPDMGVLVDLGGPKLRLGMLPNEITAEAGQTLVLGSAEVPVADPDFRALGDPGRCRNLPLGQPALVVETKNFSNFAHRVSIHPREGAHRLPSRTGQTTRLVARSIGGSRLFALLR